MNGASDHFISKQPSGNCLEGSTAMIGIFGGGFLVA
jgi:hypothetical protein